jgi:PPK2 family polyphosphate:nucleotide phosphotransferase
MNLTNELRVKPGKKVNLKDYDPEATFGYKKNDKLLAKLEKDLAQLDQLQYMLYAENKHALLVVLQAVDTAGKDGTIRHVMTGMSPQSCKVASFKTPTPEEAAHDYLWRVHKVVPERGEVGIFNRSHYEDVLVVRVHDLVPKSVWSKRYDQINHFEQLLNANGVTIVKLFLHISKKEQRERLEQRLDDPDKRWKLSLSDFKERQFWGDYQKAYEEAITRCNTGDAPWYIIPSNHKWFRNFAVSRILVETLQQLNMKFPKATVDISQVKLK